MIRIKSLLRILLNLVFTIAFVSGCSNVNKSTAQLSVSIPAISAHQAYSTMLAGDVTAPNAPADISGFNCLLVNVVGSGIGEWETNKDKVGVDRNFSYIGTYSKLIPVATGGSVQVKVSKGVKRYIQILGLKSEGGACPTDFTATDLKSVTKFPGIFIVGSVQKDILKDEVINIKTSYSVTTTADVRGTDTQPVPTGADSTSPTVSIGTITATPTNNTMAVSWTAATDSGTLQDQLKYKLVTASTTAALTTIADAEAATVATDWTSNLTSTTVTGLAPLTTYAYAVLVKDAMGNKSLYTAVSATTLPDTFSIAYNGNGSTGGAVPTDSGAYTVGSTVTVLGNTGSLVKTGFSFSSWNTAADGSGTNYSATQTFAIGAANITLYAKWVVAYSVTYNSNGSTSGTAPADSTYYPNAATVTALTNSGSLAKTNYTFSGWNTMANGSGTSYATGATFAMGSSNIILYAKWLDTTAPTIGSSISFAPVSTTSLTVNWGAGTDTVTAASSLQYKLVSSNSAVAIDTLAKADAATGSDLRMNWTANTTTKALTSLNTFDTYYFAVLVKDAAGNIAYYPQQYQQLTCGCSDGTYASNGSCVASENGTWATSCVKTSCSNKPSNSSYLGTSAASASCPWTCNQDYVPNSSFTSCDSNAGYVALACAANQVMVGISGRSGAILDKIGVRCRDLSNGALTGATNPGVEFGGNGGGPFIDDCPAGYAIYTIEAGNATYAGAAHAGTIRFRCKSLVDGTITGWSGTYGAMSDLGVNTLTCNSPYYLNWLTIGSSGAYAGAYTGNSRCKSTVTTTGLVGYWQLDNSGLDTSGNGHHGTIHGGVTYSSATKKNGTHSALFDGSSGYIDTGSSLINNLNSFTIIGWVNVVNRGGTGAMSFWGQNDLFEMGFNSTGVSNDVCFWVAGGSEVCSTTQINTGTWYQIAVSMSQAGGTKLYINGALENSAAISTVGNVSGYNFQIGGGVWNPTGNFLNGYADDIIIYNRELSSTEIRNTYGN